MSNHQYLQLVSATIRSGFSTMQKSAAASPQQQDILRAGWPADGEQITKTAALARMLATGMLVEEGEMSLAQASN